MTAKTPLEITEIEISEILLKFDHTRINCSSEINKLMRSLQDYGQLSPVIVVTEKSLHYVLIDGYRRVQALKRLEIPQVIAEIWELDEKLALVKAMTCSQNRSLEPIEQAKLIKELMEQYGLSITEIARRLGKSQSFVSRRLGLLEELPEEILKEVIKGKVSAWTATRVLAPMARAMPDHALRLGSQLEKGKYSTREISSFWNHYKKVNKKKREEMIQRPGLFLSALKTREKETDALSVRDGVEGKWLKDCRVVTSILKRLLNSLSEVFTKDRSNLEIVQVLKAFAEVESIFNCLQTSMKRKKDENSS